MIQNTRPLRSSARAIKAMKRIPIVQRPTTFVRARGRPELLGEQFLERDGAVEKWDRHDAVAVNPDSGRSTEYLDSLSRSVHNPKLDRSTRQCGHCPVIQLNVDVGGPAHFNYEFRRTHQPLGRRAFPL